MATLLHTLLFAATARAFYLPGAAPHDFLKGDQVPLFVNALTPMLTGTDDAKLVCLFVPSTLLFLTIRFK
jgi:transmembrane 9 superfamily protein 2/4